MLDRDVRIVIEHYAEMLRRHLVTESEISELCRRIYSKHKQALDLIYEHRPDRQQIVRELLEDWIRQNPDLELDHCSKSYVRFIPKKLDKAVTARMRLLGMPGGQFTVRLEAAFECTTCGSCEPCFDRPVCCGLEA